MNVLCRPRTQRNLPVRSRAEKWGKMEERETAKGKTFLTTMQTRRG